MRDMRPSHLNPTLFCRFNNVAIDRVATNKVAINTVAIDNIAVNAVVYAVRGSHLQHLARLRRVAGAAQAPHPLFWKHQ